MARDEQRPPTIKDVAREAGVSFKTVSRVINGSSSVNPDMRAAIEAAMERLAYRPNRGARSLRSNRSYTLALLCGSLPPLHDVDADTPSYFTDFLLELIVGCERGSRRSGYHMILEFLDDERDGAIEDEARALIADLKPDGVLLAPPLSDQTALMDLLDAQGIAFVRLMPGTALERGACFMIDDFAAGREIGLRLLEAGHRDIAFVSGLRNHIAAGARHGGLAAAVAEFPDARIRVVAGDFSYASGVRAAHELFDGRDRSTAIFAANDAMAAGVINTAAQKGVAVPADVSVVGFDDSFFARLLTPRLTTVRQPTREIAQTATAMLIDSAQNGRPLDARTVRLPYEIVDRASLAASPSA
ncbi:MAG TPA: LacI family DNA-binding transcriptional regulator [Croceibacterium sp.]